MNSKTRSNKLVSFLLTALLASSLFVSLPGTALACKTSGLCFSGYNIPASTLNCGQCFNICGTFNSGYKISNVSAGIYSSSGSCVMVASANPKAYTYNLSKLASSLQFQHLQPGTYYYKVMATDSCGTQIFCNTRFTVCAATKISCHNLPPSVFTRGCDFNICGNITSSGKVSCVNVGVYNYYGSRITGITHYPNATSYNISKASPFVSFYLLSPGSYYYRVSVTDAWGNSTLVNSPFTVR